MKNTPSPEFIKNTKEVYDFFGYWPTFHDDVIERFMYNYERKEIEIVILSQQGKKCTVKFHCKNVSELKLLNEEERYSGKTIVFEVKFAQKEGNIYIEVFPSVGTYISIKCKEVSVEKMDNL